MNVSIRLNDEDTLLFKSYAELNGLTLSDLFRESVIKRIEDEYDLRLYYEAMEEYKKNPITYTHEEMKKMLELD